MSTPSTETAAARPRRGDELTLDIEDLVYGGRGIARRDGFVVFVRGALPGDRVHARVTKSKRHFAEAEATEIVRPSADRVPSRCDHGGEPCPGAPWQELPYELQLEHKQRQVTDALERIGGFTGFEPEPIEPALEPWRYRNKFEYSFGERDGELVLGFHARGRWDLVVDAEDCLLASEAATPRGTGSATGRGSRASPRTTSAATRACCATSSSARGGGPASCRPAWSPRPPPSPAPRSTYTR